MSSFWCSSRLIKKMWISLQFIFDLTQNCVGLSLNVPHIIIQWIAISGIRQTDVWRDLVVEIFSLPTVGFPACEAEYRVHWLDVGSSSSHPLNPV